MHIQYNLYKWKLALILVAILFFAYGVVFSIHTINNYNVFGNGLDLADYTQMFWYMVNHGVLAYSIESSAENIIVNYQLGVHFSAIFYLFAPIYYFFQNAQTLLILQSFILGSAVFPIFLLAKEKTKNEFLVVALCICYLLYYPLHFVNNDDFHGIIFVVPLFLWCLYFLEVKTYKFFWCFFILALLVQEDAALSGIGIGMYICLNKKDYKLGGLVITISIIYFLLLAEVVMPIFYHYSAPNSTNASNFIGWYPCLIQPDQKSYLIPLKTLLGRPGQLILYVLTSKERLLYLASILLPVLFLPLYNLFRTLIIFIPPLMINLLSANNGMFSNHTHYNAPIIPFVFFLTALGCTNISSQIRKCILPILLILSSILTNYVFSNSFSLEINPTLLPNFNAKFGDIFKFHSNLLETPVMSEHNKILHGLIKQIPAMASLTTNGNMISHLVNRPKIVMERIPTKTSDLDYILLDTSIDPPYRKKYIPAISKLLQNNTYGVITYKNDCLLLCKGCQTIQNKGVIQKLKQYWPKPH